MSVPAAKAGLILKGAFTMAVLLYAGVAVAVLGVPDMDAPVLPEDPPGSILVLVVPPVALVLLAAGALMGRRSAPEIEPPQGWAIWGTTRFILGAALVEGGAILSLALAFLARDARWAILGAVPAAVLIALAPTSVGKYDG